MSLLTTSILISLVIIVLVIIIFAAAITKGYSYKHTVDTLEDNRHVNHQTQKSGQDEVKEKTKNHILNRGD
ncbi:YtzI protein [Fictibacillus nanhaiensis]|uniref:YtzI protein n=1 Tax=Fictibacillus nanhaiensis TaxID=742169 RepID=UPI001C96EC20|nr:YtzI protein [Fictibacillus nanhaiensis]MBY6037857.1 YtzI protein [Fictibacillus nanhaiensis]